MEKSETDREEAEIGIPAADTKELNRSFIETLQARKSSPEFIFVQKILKKIRLQKGLDDSVNIDYSRLIPDDLSRSKIIENFQRYCDEIKVRVNCGVLFEKSALEFEAARGKERKNSGHVRVQQRQFQDVAEDEYEQLRQLQSERRARAKSVYFQRKVEEARTLDDVSLLAEIRKQFENDAKLARYLCVEYLLRRLKVITDFRTDGIKVYDDERRYYKETGAERIKAMLTAQIGLNNTKSTAEEVLHLLRTKTYVYDEDIQKAAPLNLIPLKNGIYDVATGRLLDHDPKYLFDFQVPVDFDPDAQCPAIDDFLKAVVDEEGRSLIYDIFGLALYRMNYLDKFFILGGAGSNGKSTLLILLQHFVGEENHSTITLKQLTEDRFAVARTYRKLVNVGPDIGGEPIKDTSMLKAASSKEKINGQFKFGQIFDFRPSATLVFSANNPPIFMDDSMGMYRRVETILFPFTFGNEKDVAQTPGTRRADPSILQKMTTAKELSGLLNVAIAHLQAILRTGQLSVVRSNTELKLSYMKQSNSVQAFIEECCEEAEYVAADKALGAVIPASGYLTIKELYAEYILFCKGQRLTPKTKDAFAKRLKALPSWNLEMGQKDGVGGDRERSLRGIKWKGRMERDAHDPSDPSSLFFNRAERESEDKIEIGKAVPDGRDTVVDIDTTHLPCASCGLIGNGWTHELKGKVVCDLCARRGDV